LANRLQGHRRAVARQQRIVTGLLVLLLAVTGYYFVGVLPHAEPNFGGIVCSELHDLMPQYLAKQLDAATSARIDEHLRHCKTCRGAMESMAPGSRPVSDSANMPTGNVVASHAEDHEQFLRVAIASFASLDR
jgi:hypothetical protein